MRIFYTINYSLKILIIKKVAFGKLACFDNFSNERARVVSLLEKNYDSNLRLCSRAVKDNWRKFDSFGGGLSYDDASGDFVAVFAISDKE